MPIIHLGSQEDIGKPDFGYHLLGYCHRQYVPDVPYDERPEIEGPTVYATYTSHHGLCLEDFERNGYDDSDFYMIVWNEEKGAPETICFASTRGWSYPCYGSSPDATPEVRAKYAAWKEARRQEGIKARKDARRKELRALIAQAKEVAAKNDLDHVALLRLRKLYTEKKLPLILGLFGDRIRSKFKLSLRQQLVNWLKDPAPKYRSPFSPKQVEFL